MLRLDPRRLFATTLAAALVMLSPGLAPYEAVASELHAASPVAGARAAALPAAQSPVVATPFGDAAVLPGLLPISGIALPQAAAPAADSRDQAARSAAELSRSVSETLAPLGDLSAAPHGQAREAGYAVEDILTSRRAAAYAESFAAPQAAGMGSFSAAAPASDPAYYLAEPAGQQSIGAAAQAFFGGSSRAMPPAPAGSDSDNNNNNNNEQRPPLVPRLITSALAVVPAVLLGWPLFAAGSVVAGALIMLTSAAIAALPFLEKPGALRAVPGVLLGATALAAVAAGVSAGAFWVGAMGALALAGSYGFVRFGLGRSEERSASAVLGAFFGALGAVTGVGVALLGPAGIAATVAAYAAPVLTLGLLAHLPGWVGAGIRGAFEALYLSVEDGLRVAFAIGRDTTQRKRLGAFTDAALDASHWNALWLGLVVWLPVLIVEGVKAAAGVASGLLNGALRMIPLAGWSVAHKLSPKSGAARYLAGWTKTSFAMQKTVQFNEQELKLIPWADSPSRLKRWTAAGLITVMQFGWFALSPIVTLAATVVGLKAAPETDDEKLDPRAFRLERDPLPSRVPEVAKTEVSKAWAWLARLAATGIGLAPLYWLFTPLLAGGLLGWGALGASTLIAAMPLMPENAKVPEFLRNLPGQLLSATGAFAAYGAAQMWWIGLPTGFIFPLAILAVLSGAGFTTMIEKLRNPETKTYNVNDYQYVGGFAAAVALSAAIGLAFIGTAGLLGTAAAGLALLLSPALLAHLPRHFWSGVFAGLTAFWPAGQKLEKVLGFERHDTKYSSNVSALYRYWLKQNFWNWVVIAPRGAANLAFSLAEFAATAAFAVALWPVRALSAFAFAMASRKQYDSPSTKFWRGFHEYLVDSAEGAKPSFDKWAAPLIEAINETKEKTGGPTLKADLAMLAARFLQLAWLVRVAVMAALTPLLVLPAIQAGRRKQADAPKA